MRQRMPPATASATATSTSTSTSQPYGTGHRQVPTPGHGQLRGELGGPHDPRQTRTPGRSLGRPLNPPRPDSRRDHGNHRPDPQTPPPRSAHAFIVSTPAPRTSPQARHSP